MPFERGGLAIAEAANDMPTRCECCVIPKQLLPRYVDKGAPLQWRCPSSGVVYFQKQTFAGRVILAGLEVVS